MNWFLLIALLGFWGDEIKAEVRSEAFKFFLKTYQENPDLMSLYGLQSQRLFASVSVEGNALNRDKLQEDLENKLEQANIAFKTFDQIMKESKISDLQEKGLVVFHKVMPPGAFQKVVPQDG